MSVSNVAQLGDSSETRYTPFRGADRRGAVGTVQGGFGVTGDGTAGGATLRLTVVGQEFGFPWLIAFTSVQSSDTLTTPEGVRLGILGDPANARVGINMAFVLQTIAAGGLNVGFVNGSLPVMELAGTALIAASNIMTWDWATNEDTKLYTAGYYGIVYDVQFMTRRKGIMLDGPILGAR